MHPQERELIVKVFERLASVAGVVKDPEAAALIAERASALPDALYGLVQAVALQDVALKQAETRIAELERQVANVPAPSFLGAAPANPWGSPRTSVPSVPPQPQYQQPQPQQYQQPQYQPQQPQAMSWGQPPAGGGFLRGVAGTAMGVAGGALLAQGISSLFSGGHGGGGGFGGGGHGSASAAAPERVAENTTINNYYGESSAADDDVASASDDYAADDSGDGSVDF